MDLLNYGMTIGLTRFKVEKWNAPPPLNQCHKCQKFGHRALNCTNSAQICPICTDPHQLKDCDNRANEKCANCNGPHPSFSKACPSVNKFREKRILPQQVKSHHQVEINSQTSNKPETSERYEKFETASNVSRHNNFINKIAIELSNLLDEMIKRVDQCIIN